MNETTQGSRPEAGVCPVEKLLDVTLTEKARRVELTLPDLEGYLAVRVYLQYGTTPSPTGLCSVLLNGESGVYRSLGARQDFLCSLRANDRADAVATAVLELSGLGPSVLAGESSWRYINATLYGGYRDGDALGRTVTGSYYLRTRGQEPLRRITLVCRARSQGDDVPSLLPGSRFVVYGLRI